jgi:hypothetical protein
MMRAPGAAVQRSRDTVAVLARLALLALALVLALPLAARAEPPRAGVLVPGESLGGARLGWSVAQLERTWGTFFGRCRNCRVETRYYNRVPFLPEGAGVELRRGRVTAVFTLWAPREWHTDRSVYVGEPERRVRTAHGAVQRRSCAGYDALVLRRSGTARSVVYVVDGKVWGFGLLGSGAQVCR